MKAFTGVVLLLALLMAALFCGALAIDAANALAAALFG